MAWFLIGWDHDHVHNAGTTRSKSVICRIQTVWLLAIVWGPTFFRAFIWVHSHGDTPIAGWFISWKIPSRNGWWLGLPPWLRKPPFWRGWFTTSISASQHLRPGRARTGSITAVTCVTYLDMAERTAMVEMRPWSERVHGLTWKKQVETGRL